jgi:GxxExxY protein
MQNFKTTETEEFEAKDSLISCMENHTAYQGGAFSEKELTEQIIGAAIDVHKHWGPGLLEEIYEKSLCREFRLRGLSFEDQLSIPLIYKEEKVGDDLRLDFFIDNKVIVEIKTVSKLAPIHSAQLMTYLKLTKCRLGLLINFNAPVLVKGIRRIIL